MWTIRIDLIEIEDSWFYQIESESMPTLREIYDLIFNDLVITRIESIVSYQEHYYDLSNLK